MSKHTPGPWYRVPNAAFVFATGPSGINSFSVSVQSAGRDRIGVNEKEANARLISAAPDLLAVLQELRECAAYWSEYDVPIGIHDRIDAAITKATGDE